MYQLWLLHTMATRFVSAATLVCHLQEGELDDEESRILEKNFFLEVMMNFGWRTIFSSDEDQEVEKL